MNAALKRRSDVELMELRARLRESLRNKTSVPLAVRHDVRVRLAEVVEELARRGFSDAVTTLDEVSDA